MSDQLHGKVFCTSRDFETIYLATEHPLEFLIDKLESYHSDYFGDCYIYNSKMICTFNNGKLDGSIEVFGDDGYLIISGSFADGLASGTWEIFHPDKNADFSFKSKWRKGQLVSPDIFFDAGEIFTWEEYRDDPKKSFSLKGENLEISHEIWGYWSNYADPVSTFKVTYKLEGSKIIERKIIQEPFWGEEETLIAIETFNDNGASKNVELHDLIKKHNAYLEPLRFKGWDGYDDDNNAEVVMVRTIELLEAREVEGSYKDEFEGIYDTSFGYGYKLNTTDTLKEMYYFAWGEKSGISMHFSEGNKIKMLKWNGKHVIWDNVNGINKKYFAIKRKNIKKMVEKREAPFDDKI